MRRPLPITPHELDAVRRPLAEARGLPHQAYVDPDWYAWEEDRIFARRWVAATFAHRVARPGDAVPVTVAGAPIVVVRGDDGELRAFHNASVADGCEVVPAPAQGLDRLVGPYHGWEWDLRGRLRAIPYWDGTPAPPLDQLSISGDLVAVGCCQWLDLVFVNMAGDAERFESVVAPVDERLAGTDLSEFEVALGADGCPLRTASTIEANWKIAFENDVELLHEAFVHEGYRQSPYSPKVDAAGTLACVTAADRGLYGLAAPTYHYYEEGELGTLPLIPVAGQPHLPEFHIYDLYPNVQLGFAADHFTLGFLTPGGPEWTVSEVAYYLHRSVAGDAEIAAIVAGGWEEARREDNVVCAATQRGRHTRGFGQTVYAPFWDDYVHHFHLQVLDDLVDEQP